MVPARLPTRDHAWFLGQSTAPDFIRPPSLARRARLTYLLASSVRTQVTFIREIPAYGAFYAGYETTKRQFLARYQPAEGQQLPVWCLMLSGATGGVSYWLASYPLGQFLVLMLSLL